MRKPPEYLPRAKKSLGQNFLADPDYISKIIAAVHPSADDTVIEIGPGRGALTERLVDSGSRVIAIELDRELIDPLRRKFGGGGRFEVIERDALTVAFGELLDEFGAAKLVANLPYYISTAILQHLAGQRDRFSSLILMFQREVVDRITAQPGSSGRGFLTVIAEAAFQIEKLFDVPPDAFRPVPKVWSSVVRLTPKAGPGLDKALRDLVSAGFAQKRKTIANNLKQITPEPGRLLAAAGIEPIRRAESLTLDEWIELGRAMKA